MKTINIENAKQLIFSKRFVFVILPAILIAILTQLKEFNISPENVAYLLALLTTITKITDILNSQIDDNENIN